MRNEYYQQVALAKIIVIMTDSTSVTSMQNAAEILYNTLTLKAYDGQPIIMLANK